MIVGTDSPRRDNDSLMALKNVIHSRGVNAVPREPIMG